MTSRAWARASRTTRSTWGTGGTHHGTSTGTSTGTTGGTGRLTACGHGAKTGAGASQVVAQAGSVRRATR